MFFRRTQSQPRTRLPEPGHSDDCLKNTSRKSINALAMRTEVRLEGLLLQLQLQLQLQQCHLWSFVFLIKWKNRSDACSNYSVRAHKALFRFLSDDFLKGMLFQLSYVYAHPCSILSSINQSIN